MLDSFNLTILKVECQDSRIQAKCRIYEDGSLKDEISMSSPSVHPVQISKSQVKLEILNEALSVSFNSDLIQKSGFHYLPLFPSSSPSELTELPDHSKIPRVLVNIYPKLMTPNFEITESSELNDDSSESSSIEDYSKLKSRNLELMIKVTELENSVKQSQAQFKVEMEEMAFRYKEKVKDLSDEIEKLTVIQSKNLKISAEIKRENESLKRKIEELERNNLEIEEDLNRFRKVTDDTRTREESILMILEIKDKEIMRLKKRKLNEGLKIDRRENLTCLPACNLPDWESTGNRTSRASVGNGENFSCVKIGSRMNDGSGCRTFADCDKMKKLALVDRKVYEFTQSIGLDGILSLNEELLYSVGSKKVNVFVKKDSIYVRFGTCLKPIETFLVNNCAQEVQKFRMNRKKTELKTFHKKSLSELEKIENSAISRTFDDEFKRKLLHISTSKPSAPRVRYSFSPVSQILSTRNLNLF